MAPGGLGGRDFRLLLAATAGALSNYAPLLAVVPLWAADGGAGSAGAGSVTAVMMGGTVAAQLSMGVLLRVLSLRSMFAIGALLMGLPTAAYLLSHELPWLLAVSAVRGVGFGMVVVAGSALVAELVPLAQRGRAIGQYGVAVAIPSVILLPLGVWLVEQIGFLPVFFAASGLALTATPLMAAMTRHRPDHATAAAPTLAGTGRWRPLAAPWLLLVTAAAALGGVVTFVPLTLASSTTASLVLFAASAAMAAGRLTAGALRDRLGHGSALLVAGVLSCSTGMAGLGIALDLTTAVALVSITAGTAYGFGFGMIQNETLVVMFDRAGPGGHGRASTVWNLAYDAGSGAGAYAIGLVAIQLGMGGAFLIAALVIVLALPATRR